MTQGGRGCPYFKNVFHPLFAHLSKSHDYFSIFRLKMNTYEPESGRTVDEAKSGTVTSKAVESAGMRRVAVFLKIEKRLQ